MSAAPYGAQATVIWLVLYSLLYAFGFRWLLQIGRLLLADFEAESCGVIGKHYGVTGVRFAGAERK
jgi:hypothetical protein